MIFFFNDTATTEIYTLSLHDALPICPQRAGRAVRRSGRLRRGADYLHHPRPKPPGARGDSGGEGGGPSGGRSFGVAGDRKSTRLNSSHANISYAVFCLKKNNLRRYSI